MQNRYISKSLLRNTLHILVYVLYDWLIHACSSVLNLNLTIQMKAYYCQKERTFTICVLLLQLWTIQYSLNFGYVHPLMSDGCLKGTSMSLDG